MKLIILVFKQKGVAHDGHLLGFIWQMAYTIKTIACILLKRKKVLNGGIRMAVWDFNKGKSVDYGQFYTWKEIIISTGVKNWYYDTVSRSSISGRLTQI